MLFRQLFESESASFSYLIADNVGGHAVIVDSQQSKIPLLLQMLEEFQLTLTLALDTHLHADHITGLGVLQDKSACEIRMGKQSKAKGLTKFFEDKEVITVGALSFQALYTPGHTDDSYCFLFDDRVLTGDTLFIRGTGRTDFQHGDAATQYDSLQKLLALPDKTLVFPGHDYYGRNVSTIGEERAFNPRLQHEKKAYCDLMDNLGLENPKLIDVAVPANTMCGRIGKI